jgi:hypothetical protein
MTAKGRSLIETIPVAAELPTRDRRLLMESHFTGTDRRGVCWVKGQEARGQAPQPSRRVVPAKQAVAVRKSDRDELAKLRAEKTVRRLCESLGFQPSATQLKAVARLGNAAKKRQLIESFIAAGRASRNVLESEAGGIGVARDLRLLRGQ